MARRRKEFEMITYKATKRNRNHTIRNLVSSGSTNILSNSVTIKLDRKLTKNEFKTLSKILNWLLDILAVDISYNKQEQLEQILFEHFISLNMSSDLAQKLTNNLLKVD
jgi:hypothetical protein